MSESAQIERKITYTVRCRFEKREVADRWLAWLRNGHLADVVAAGAESARAVDLDGEPPCCEAHYVFANRLAFDAYERDHAPRLRAEGLELFPLELGLQYSRSVGELLMEI